MDPFGGVSTVKTLGEVVGLVEQRPVIRSNRTNDLIPGNALGFLDLRLVNFLGEEKVVRVPVSSEVIDFYRKV
jgi:hypothetical protein